VPLAQRSAGHNPFADSHEITDVAINDPDEVRDVLTYEVELQAVSYGFIRVAQSCTYSLLISYLLTYLLTHLFDK